MALRTEINPSAKRRVSSGEQNRLKTVALRAYCDHKNQQQSKEHNRIIELLPMVPKLARRVVMYLAPPLTFEDLVAAGTVGLVKAAKDYDPSHQANFKTYAYIRIRGAILDELKKWSFIPAEMTKKISSVQKAAKNIKQNTGSDPTDNQIAEKMNITVEQLYEIYKSQRARLFLSIDNSLQNSAPLARSLYAEEANAPQNNIEKSELIDVLAKTIQQLPEKKRQIIILYYQKNLTMKQIAQVLNITESRVSQLHAAALFNLSCKLREYDNARK
ncbi:MAG: FliA/WhiG family RNA polymerase sigma factor [Sedimentisphaerales bacterium]|nr:FliA/WhiG family RNA polymerase sigma factor [Sedimentisphaerales bacterium]